MPLKPASAFQTQIRPHILILALWSAFLVNILMANDAEKWDLRNRDGQLPKFPPMTDLRRQSGAIVEAHEILRKSLQQFLNFQDKDLSTYLSYIIHHRTEPFFDEYGQLISSYKKVFRFIWNQYNETQVQNYAVKQFDNDKLDMCSVARYFSHKEEVDDREDLMKRMGDALGYRCHPCTPYKRKEFGGTVVPNTDSIDPNGVSPEESFKMCKNFDAEGNLVSSSTIKPITDEPIVSSSPIYSLPEIPPAQSEDNSNKCCEPPNAVKVFGIVISGGNCADGRESTPCCGRGKCNVLCCDCPGGCWA